MGMIKKMIEPNKIQDGGGLSSLLVPVKASPLGVSVIGAGILGVSAVNNLVATRNKHTLGRITYMGRPARMTSSVPNSPIASGITRVSGGNPELAAGIIEDVMTNDSITGKIQNYGVTPQFVSAFYGM